MNTKSSPVESVLLLQLALALFFGISGLLYLLNYNSIGAEIGRSFARLFGNNNVLIVVAAIIKIIAGAVLFIGLFGLVKPQQMFIASLAILFLWGVQIIMVHFVGNFLEPDILPWLQSLSFDVIILAAIWNCSSHYSRA